MEPDYPAAHSMYTAWFAVDKCGHVAVFWPGEAGSVAEGAPDPTESFQKGEPFPGELDHCLAQKGVVPGVHSTALKGLVWERETPAAEGFYLLGPGIKADPNRIRRPATSDQKPSWIDPSFGTTDGRDWVQGYLHPESWAWLHAAPHRCLGCVTALPLDTSRRMDMYGVFQYHCDNGNHPYDKAGQPYTAVTLEELRRKVAKPIPDAPQFPQFCFREKNRIQPHQWIPSESFPGEDVWTDEEGRKRDVDGTILR